MDELLQRLLLAGALGLTVARRAAAILEGEQECGPADPLVLRAILDAANESLGHFDDRPPADRLCDATLRLLDLAAFAARLGGGLAGSAGTADGPAVLKTVFRRSGTGGVIGSS